jgi:hypothetical protein
MEFRERIFNIQPKGAGMIWNNLNRLRAKIANFFQRGKRQKVFEFPLSVKKNEVPVVNRGSISYSKAMLNRIEKRRARNRMARKSRRVNRLRAA